MCSTVWEAVCETQLVMRMKSNDDCAGYVRRVTHDEIADVVG